MTSLYRVVYFISPAGENPVKHFLDSLQHNQKVKVFRLFQVYEQYGLASIMPHTKKLRGTPLWEISIKGKDNIRVLYVSRTTKSILVLHGFIKKTQKTPQKELGLAIQRYEEWKKRT